MPTGQGEVKTKLLSPFEDGLMYLQLLLLSLRCMSRLSYLQFFAFYLMLQSGHVSRSQSQGIYIHVLSQFGPSLGKTFHVLFPFIAAKDHDFDLR